MKDEDQIVQLIGPMGRWQAIIIFLISITGVAMSWQILVLTFLTPKVDYVCMPTSEDQSISRNYSEWMDLSKQLNSNLSQCNATLFTGDSFEVTDEPCKGTWVYDKSRFPNTIITQFDLVCQNDWYITISQAIFMLGVLFGAVISGVFSDRFGRKGIIIASAFGSLIFGIAAAFAPSMAVFMFLRFCIAFFNITLFTVAYVYCMELVSAKWSIIIGIGLEFPWALGYSVLPAIAYAIPDWSWLQLTISLPTILVVLVTFIVPESARWLLTQGRIEEAEDILQRGMEINGKPWPEGLTLKPVVEPTQSSAKIWDLCRTPNLRKKTLIQYFNWFTASLVYYGLTLNSGSLIPGDLYINFLVSGLIEFPAYALTILVLLFAGRRLPLSITFFIGGLSLLLTMAWNDPTYILVLSTLGKFGVTCAFAIVYLYAAELFPTVLRNSGLGSSSMFARVGGILAPVIGRELAKIDKNIVIVFFAVTSILSGILTLFLPETHNAYLPDTLDEGEEFGEDDTAIKSCIKSSRVSDSKDSKRGSHNRAFSS